MDRRKAQACSAFAKKAGSGLAQAKKDNFIRHHGRLTCERCAMDPVAVYGGVHGLACIEVHHHSAQVEDMSEVHRTRLEDLQCLCANCHRVVHRLPKLALQVEEAIANAEAQNALRHAMAHSDGAHSKNETAARRLGGEAAAAALTLT